MRAAVAFIIPTIFGCALLASNAHKPFELRIDDAAHMTAPASAELAPSNYTLWSDATPPLRFQKDAGAIVYFKTDVSDLCGSAPFIACQDGEVMVLPNPCRYAHETYGRVVCHELGHRNGWPKNHGD